MKNIFSFLIQAYRTPRHFIQLLAVRWRQLLQISFVCIIALSIVNFVEIQPILQEIKHDAQGVIDYIPNYVYDDFNQLSLNNDKGLYYQSSFFQLVIDDQITLDEAATNLPITSEQLEAIDTNAPFSLYLFNRISLLTVNSQVYRINPQSLSREQLLSYLQFFIAPSLGELVGQFLVLFVSATLSYVFQMIFFAFLLTLINRSIVPKMKFKQRLKLTIGISFLPIVALSIYHVIVPSSLLTFSVVLIPLFYYVRRAIQEHSFYIHSHLKHLNNQDTILFSDIFDIFDELDYERDSPYYLNKQIRHLQHHASQDLSLNDQDPSNQADKTSDESHQDD